MCLNDLFSGAHFNEEIKELDQTTKNKIEPTSAIPISEIEKLN
jgi:hypothetical protein